MPEEAGKRAALVDDLGNMLGTSRAATFPAFR